MLKPIMFLLFTVLAVACSARTEPGAAETQSHGATVCTSIADDAPADDCGPEQTVVTRCNATEANPNPARCTGPRGSERQSYGDTWCCQPAPKFNLDNCYVEPDETRCGQAMALWCHAPQTAPISAGCQNLDTGTDIGSQWCCAVVR